jgi:hypothetical protein
MAVTIYGDGTVTGLVAGGLPDATVQQADLASNVAGTGPAFFVYSTGSLSASAAADTKITLNTEVYDTNNNFDSTTNYRFTPTVAGYYQFNGIIKGNLATTGGNSYIVLNYYKNGSLYYQSALMQPTNGNTQVITSSVIMYLNGSTDYIEMYVGTNNGGTFTFASQGTTYASSLSGCLIKGA